MGTYTLNYNLFMPTIGEQGWGDLVNGNFTTIDITMKGLSNRATALENADTTFNTRITTIEAVVSNGNVTANVITANQFVGNISGTATELNRVVNVSPSNVKINNGYETMMTLLPYVPGVKYSGTIGGQLYRGGTTTNGRIRTSILKDGAWMTNEHSLSTSGTEPFTLTLDNIDMLWIYQSGAGITSSSPKSFVYLPLFT